MDICSCDFEVNQTKVKGGCQSGRKVVPHDSKSDLPLVVQADRIEALYGSSLSLTLPILPHSFSVNPAPRH